MKKILVIGCSWSRQYADPGDSIKISWPELMQQQLLDRGLDVQTTNTSQICSSIFAQWHNLKFYLPLQWDLVILQFTGTQRQTYVRDEIEYNSYLNTLAPGFNGVQGYTELDYDTMVSDWITYGFNRHGFLHLNPGTATSSSKTSEMKEAYLTDCLHSMYATTQESKELQVLIEKEMIATVKSHNIPVIAYRHWRNPVYNIKYNEHLDFCVSDDLENWKDYQVDGGQHFGRRGNTALLEKLIMPRVLQCIDTKI